MIRRPYRDAADLARLQAFNAAASAATDGCGFIHPGDIPHRLFNGNKLSDPAEVMTIWEDEDGIAAWVLASPRFRCFDAQVRPNRRDPGFEREVLVYAGEQTVDLMRRQEIDADHVTADAYRCDAVRADLLVDLGWEPGPDPPWVLNRIRLEGLPDPEVPAGYTVRSVRGVEEAAAVAAVHVASFGATWTPELYRTVMESPGYAAEREFVAEAADGTFAAFTVTWHDPVNRTGLFEPVGTHRDHRRRGLGRALLLHGMHRMAAAGMEYATVVNEGTNDAARGLYRSCGFEPWHLLDDYVKPFPA